MKKYIILITLILAMLCLSVAQAADTIGTAYRPISNGYFTKITLGGVEYSTLTATATDIALAADGDFGDFDIDSADRISFLDATDYIDGGDGNLTILTNGSLTIDATEFDVSGTTGAITINDGGNAGNISIEGTVLDINDLVFVGAGEIKTAAGTALTLSADDGATAAEDLIITANNISLTAVGLMTLSPDGALAIAINAEDTDIATAISVGANDIVGTTGLINYTNFDVNADGDVTAVDGTFSGNMSVTGTFQQDSITAATAATTLTVDGTGVGGVTIGGTSTGAVTLGGGAIQVTLPSTVDLVLSGGDITATDTANADMVTFTNNTMTTADLLTLTAGGTRTSDNVLEIADSATIATTVGITANAATSADVISVTADALNTGTMLLLASNGIPAATYYARFYDGAANDLVIGANGISTYTGVASTDIITVTAGDIQLAAGDIDMDRGFITVDNDQDEANYIKRNFNGAGTGAVLTVEDTDTDTTNSTLNVVGAGNAGTALKIDQTGTGNAIGIDLNVAGDLAAIDIDASAARTGDIIDITMANQLAQRALKISGAATGTASQGLIDIQSTGAIAGSLLRLDADTAQMQAVNGALLIVDDDTTAAAATQYAVSIDSNANGALYVSKGNVLVTNNVGIGPQTVIDRSLHVETDNAATNTQIPVAKLSLTSTGAPAAGLGPTLEFEVETAAGAPGNQEILATIGTIITDATGASEDSAIVFNEMIGGAAASEVARFQGPLMSIAPKTFAFTTEGNMDTILTSSIILLDGDDDAENDTIDIQNGTNAGQIVHLIAAVEIDASDTCTINFGDTTCTNCPAVAFDKVGENVSLIWTGATWVVTSLQASL